MFVTNRIAKTNRPALRLEALEAREVPAVLIQLDYSRDVSGFFNNAEARATLEQVAAELGGALTTNLAAIAPGGGNTWSATFFDPASGGQTSVPNLTVGANTLKIYVGARDLPGSTAGFGGYGGNSISGSQAWLNAVQTRGASGFAPWGGSITFDTTQNWHLGSSTSGLDANELDFYSVAVHEMGHVLGIGTAPQWKGLVSGGAFRGGAAMNVYGGAVPVSGAGDHWAEGITVNGAAVSLDPSLPFGRRIGFTDLDRAALSDLGWNRGGAAASPPPAGPASVTLVPLVQPNGTIKQVAVVNGQLVATGAVFTPFPGYVGALHQAYGDFNGDGHYDVAVATVGNRPGALAIISGLNGSYLGGPRISAGGFQAVFAFDADSDGTTELVTLEGGRSIYVYDTAGGQLTPDGKFAAFGAPGRAALTAGGELDRTGEGDTIAEYNAEQKAKTDAEAERAAAYTVTASSDPRGGLCGCGACLALVQVAEAGESAATDDYGLVPTVRVA